MNHRLPCRRISMMDTPTAAFPFAKSSNVSGPFEVRLPYIISIFVYSLLTANIV